MKGRAGGGKEREEKEGGLVGVVGDRRTEGRRDGGRAYWNVWLMKERKRRKRRSMSD